MHPFVVLCFCYRYLFAITESTVSQYRSSRMSPSSSTEIADRQFVVICSEKEAKVGIIVLARRGGGSLATSSNRKTIWNEEQGSYCFTM